MEGVRSEAQWFLPPLWHSFSCHDHCCLQSGKTSLRKLGLLRGELHSLVPAHDAPGPPGRVVGVVEGMEMMELRRLLPLPPLVPQAPLHLGRWCQFQSLKNMLSTEGRMHLHLQGGELATVRHPPYPMPQCGALEVETRKRAYPCVVFVHKSPTKKTRRQLQQDTTWVGGGGE